MHVLLRDHLGNEIDLIMIKKQAHKPLKSNPHLRKTINCYPVSGIGANINHHLMVTSLSG